MQTTANITVHLTAAKTADQIKLDGIAVVLIKGDHDALRAVHFRDAKGNQCRVVLNGYSTLECLVVAPPKIEKRYVLHADLPVVGEVKKVFVHQSEANEAKRELSALTTDGSAEITVEDVEVENAAVVHGDDIPF